MSDTVKFVDEKDLAKECKDFVWGLLKEEERQVLMDAAFEKRLEGFKIVLNKIG